MVNFIEKGISNIADFAGFFPVVSTITGIMRIIYGKAKQIFNDYQIRQNKYDEKVCGKFYEESYKGKKHVKLGKLEVIPFAKLINLVNKLRFSSQYEIVS